MLMKCKPTYQFQSIEFDYSVNSAADLPDMFKLYEKVLKGLMEIAPIQEKQAQLPKDPPATQRQKDIMDLHGIKYKPDCTTKEAQVLIQKSINGV